MTQDDIIRMAREAGLSERDAMGRPAFLGNSYDLERFAALVAAAERNILAAWMIQFGFATGHGDTMEQLVDALGSEIVDRIEFEIDTEREACAKLCDEIAIDMCNLYKGRPPYKGDEEGRASDFTQGRSAGADDCAEAIRKRSNT